MDSRELRADGKPVGWPLDIKVTYGPDNWPILSAGKFTAKRFLYFKKEYIYRKPDVFVSGFKRIYVDGDKPGEIKKRRWTWIGENIGYNFHVSWNKMMYREWVAPREEVAKQFCYKRRGWSPDLLCDLFMMSEVVDQCVADGTTNLIPFVLRYRLDVPELKKAFGNGTWKKIAKNAVSRNKMIADIFPNIITTNRVIFDVPSHILREWPGVMPLVNPSVMREIEQAKKERRLTKITSGQLINMEYIIRDTQRMCRQQNRPFSDGWSYRRIERLHTDLVRELVRFKPRTTVDPSPFETFCGPGTVADDHFILRLLTTPAEIQEEGQEMHHCVASYISDVRQGNCSIYSLRDLEGKRLTTVQIYKDGTVGQHYGKYNANPHPTVRTWLMGVVFDWDQKRRFEQNRAAEISQVSVATEDADAMR